MKTMTIDDLKDDSQYLVHYKRIKVKELKQGILLKALYYNSVKPNETMNYCASVDGSPIKIWDNLAVDIEIHVKMPTVASVLRDKLKRLYTKFETVSNYLAKKREEKHRFKNCLIASR